MGLVPVGRGQLGEKICGPQVTRRSAKHGRKIEVTATELDSARRVLFFRDVLGPLARSIPFGFWFARMVDGVDLRDPAGTAGGRVVFELHPVQ